MKTKNLSEENENLMEKEQNKNKIGCFQVLLAVIILLLALNILIGNFLLLLPSDFSLKGISLNHVFRPYIVIPNIGALYAIFVAVLFLCGKKKILIEALLILLLILIFIWLLWSAFFFYAVRFFGGVVIDFIPSIINLVLSPTAIIAIFIYLIKTKKGEKTK